MTTTLLDEQRLAPKTARMPTPQRHVLSHIDALAPTVTRFAPEIERARRLPAELVSALGSTRIYGMLVPGGMAALDWTRRALFARSRPWRVSTGRWARMP